MKYKEIILTDFQKYALIGTILGDTYIGIDKKGKNARMNFAHSDAQEEYYMHKYNLFKDFGGTSKYYEKEDRRTHKVYKKFTYTSKTHPILTDLHNMFYPNGKTKIIPENIEDIFNDVSLAYLFMDDGSHHKKGYYLSLCKFELDELNGFGVLIQTVFS